MPKPDADETTSYTPLSDRLNQDVIHDNCVPKYSALSNAPRTKLVLVGVWLIFLPMSFGIFALPMHLWTGNDDLLAGLVYALLTTAFGVLALVILFAQTMRCLNRDDAD